MWFGLWVNVLPGIALVIAYPTKAHGWYWENTTNEPLTLTLTAAGFYNVSHEFRSGAPVENKIF